MSEPKLQMDINISLFIGIFLNGHLFTKNSEYSDIFSTDINLVNVFYSPSW